MKYKSQVFTEASGSVGGLTFSHNKGGLYTRARAVPTNPNTPFQQVIRNATTFLTNAWVDILTDADRASWQTYTDNVIMRNVLGAAIKLPALAHYVRSNVSRLQQGLPRVDSAPVIFNLGAFSTPTFTFAASGSILSVTFDVADPWVSEDDSAMLVYTSRQQNPTIVFFKGPYRLAGAILGEVASPPTSPADIVAPFPATVGNSVFVRVRVTRADGRLSDDFRNFAISA